MAYINTLPIFKYKALKASCHTVGFILWMYGNRERPWVYEVGCLRSDKWTKFHIKFRCRVKV